MSFLNDTYCQICERLITWEQWDKDLYSRRHLHKKTHGYTPAYFTNRKLTGDEGSKIEKASWRMDIKEVDEFLITIFMMVTDLKYYFDKSEKFKKRFQRWWGRSIWASFVW